jgi:hypothetical protein
MFIVVAISSVVAVFSLMSAKALLSQSSYQHKVLSEKNKAIQQLKDNVDAANKLKTQYDIFAKQDPNIIGGSGGENAGTGAKDGDNARIVLDALPSQYDFPALITSIEKVVGDAHVTLQGLNGTDEGKDSNVPGSASSAAGGSADPIPITFSVGILSDYKNSEKLVEDFEHSIRPIDITTFSLNGSSSNITTSMQANTYYQPSISLQIQQKEVK